MPKNVTSGGISYVLAKKDLSAVVVKSPKASGDVVIPRTVHHGVRSYTVKRVDDEAFAENQNIESISFPEDSLVESIGKEAFHKSSVKKITLPESIKQLDEGWNKNTKDLIEINVIKEKHFAWFEGVFLLGKSDAHSDFDQLLFARRNIEGSVKIPLWIKHIRSRAFQYCEHLRSLSFEGSVLETIGYGAFNFCLSLVDLDPLPKSLKTIEYGCFCGAEKLESITLLGDNISIDSNSFDYCTSLTSISFPNAHKISIGTDVFKDVPSSYVVFIGPDVEIIGEGANEIENNLQRLSNSSTLNSVAFISTLYSKNDYDSVSKFDSSKLVSDDNQSESGKSKFGNDVINIMFKRIRKLEGELSRYERIVPFNMHHVIKEISRHRDSDSKNPTPTDSFLTHLDVKDYEVESSSIATIGGNNNENENENENPDNNSKNKENYFVGPNQGRFFRTLGIIAEGNHSISYRVVDTRNNKVFCKKVLKVNQNHKKVEMDIDNIYKHFSIIHAISHPCVCAAYGINTSEKVDEKQPDLVTTALFLEYLEFNLKDMINSPFLSNTLKARIALEIASGMLHLHERGMIHCCLKIEHIMLNSVFEAKIIDLQIELGFDSLVHQDGLSRDGKISKSNRTLVSMSPELADDKDYDGKTDVYSFGTILYHLFTGKPLEQPAKDKSEGASIKMPTPSDNISQFCIDLIQKCVAFDPNNRPTFKDILDEMRNRSYDLAAQIDSEVVARRHRSLERFEALHQTPFRL